MTLTPLKNKIGKSEAWRLDIPGKKSQIFYRRSSAIREMTKLAQGKAMTTVTNDIKVELQKAVLKVDGRAHFNIDLHGQIFPGRLIKRFIATLPDGWSAYLGQDQVNFFWTNGKAHINSVNRIIELRAIEEKKNKEKKPWER